MTNGRLEPEKDAATLMRIYNNFDADGKQRGWLSRDEQVLIFALAQAISEGKIINAEEDAR